MDIDKDFAYRTSKGEGEGGEKDEEREKSGD